MIEPVRQKSIQIAVGPVIWSRRTHKLKSFIFQPAIEAIHLRKNSNSRLIRERSFRSEANRCKSRGLQRGCVTSDNYGLVAPHASIGIERGPLLPVEVIPKLTNIKRYRRIDSDLCRRNPSGAQRSSRDFTEFVDPLSKCSILRRFCSGSSIYEKPSEFIEGHG